MCYVCQSLSNESISIEKDKMGFAYPRIDMLKCTDCGVCEKICPNLKKQHGKNFFDRIICCEER